MQFEGFGILGDWLYDLLKMRQLKVDSQECRDEVLIMAVTRSVSRLSLVRA